MPRANTSPVVTPEDVTPEEEVVNEKRSSQRVPVKVRARYRSELVSLDGWVANLSRCGLFLTTDLLDCEGSTAVLELAIPGGEPVNVNCEVVRVDLEPGTSGMGVRFQGLTKDHQRLLANFMIERSYPAPAGA